MSDWFGRARKLLGVSREGELAIPVTLVCPCGARVPGWRRGRAAIHRCPQCGGSLFVFPQSPLEGPSAATRVRPVRKRHRREESPSALANPAPAPAPEDIQPRPSVRPRRVGPRAVIFLVLALVVLTTWWHLRREQFRRLHEDLAPLAERGMAALEEGDYELARAQLERVVGILDRLDHRSAEEARYRQAHAEVAIVTDLLDEPIESALQDVVRGRASPASTLAGRALVLDTLVGPRPEGGWILGYVPVLAEDGPVPFHPDGLELFDRLGIESNTRLVIGARIEGLVANGGQVWVRLDPRSGVRMSQARILQSLQLAGGAVPTRELAARPTAGLPVVGDSDEVVRRRWGEPSRVARLVTHDPLRRSARTMHQWVYLGFGAGGGDTYVLLEESSDGPPRLARPPQTVAPAQLFFPPR